MSGVVKWIVGHATEVGLVLGAVGCLTGLIYLYDFLSTRKKRKAKTPVVIPRELEGRRNRDDVEKYGEDWSKKLDSVVSEMKSKR